MGHKQHWRAFNYYNKLLHIKKKEESASKIISVQLYIHFKG